MCSQVFRQSLNMSDDDAAPGLIAAGEWIRKRREAKGVSMAQAARRVGTTTQRWHAIEHATLSTKTGHPSKPAVPLLRAIADYLDGDRAEILELAGYADDALYDRAFPRRHDPETTAYSNKLDQLSDRDRRTVERLIDDLLGDESQQ